MADQNPKSYDRTENGKRVGRIKQLTGKITAQAENEKPERMRNTLDPLGHVPTHAVAMKKIIHRTQGDVRVIPQPCIKNDNGRVSKVSRTHRETPI